MQRERNLTWHASKVDRKEREERNGHGSCVIWFTGLSGSGKSTLAFALERELFDRGIFSYVLDGDNVRHGLNGDLGFSEADRKENLRRIAEMSRLFTDAGMIVLSAFISPHAQDREMVRNIVGPEQFAEVYVKCSLEECEKRDPKGLYVKARKGEIPEFTGISAPYDIPVEPEMVIDTEHTSLQESVDQLIQFLIQKGFAGRTYKD
ncbi:adenylyl-sulfate kinase [Paenibacillus lacisoli]|uniref:adenylyl-sulfate kinase n=1 Tax=Paenibacillus lacisoli TaxID=3064525 RepID=UPI00387E4617